MDGALRNMASVYITSRGKMLMLYRIGSRVVSPCWCGIGGHFEKEELNNAKAAVLRELNEEIGLNEKDLTKIDLKYITLRYKDYEIRLNYYFFAELCENAAIQDYCNEGNIEWIDMDRVLNKEMPYTAKYVLEHYMKTGRYSDLTYCGVAQKNGISFIELEEF
ncbi:MAG: 8-oxo-dGTP diphosphatase [Firmicutes bacterium ADurb.Bin182]|nr:MAG: 8-oxo-dGTP diphosphatase [Firmicutes bacterium ADurb.Bin182]